MRNRILTAIDLFSFVLFGIMLAGLIIFLHDGKLSSVPEMERTLSITSEGFLLKNSPLAAMIASLSFTFYIGIFGVYLLLAFEKTQCIETVYLTTFFIGCLFQSATILVPLLELWKNSTELLMFVGKIQIFGTLLSTFSFMLLAIFIGSSSFIDTDRNVIISVAMSAFVACVIPINFTKIFSNFWLHTGFDRLIVIFQFVVFFIYICIFSVYSRKNDISLWESPVLYGIFMFLGYYFLTLTDNYFMLVVSQVSLFGGTYGFIRIVRKQYRWL